MASGDLMTWLTRLSVAINAIPNLSFYSGNPNSSLTGAVGDLAVNLASADTARLWIKIYGSAKTGWCSASTSP